MVHVGVPVDEQDGLVTLAQVALSLPLQVGLPVYLPVLSMHDAVTVCCVDFPEPDPPLAPDDEAYEEARFAMVKNCCGEPWLST